MANRFSVEPLGGYGPSMLAGIGQIAAKNKMQREQKAESEKQMKQRLEVVEAVRSKDPNRIGDIMLKYPEQQKAIMQNIQARGKPVNDIETEMYRQLLVNPQGSQQIFQQGLQQLKQVNADEQTMSGILQDMDALEAGDAEAMRRVEAKVAATDTDFWKEYSKQKKERNKSLLNDEEPTAGMKDFKYYQSLKKSDPEAAKQFGVERGFITDEGRELSSHMQKRLSLASDEAINSEANVSKYSTLANEVEGADISGGLLGGKWSESFKDITGSQDAVTDLRKKYNAIRASQAVTNLPPGAASDKDIALALSGFPSDNASGTQLASFLRGLSKLEAERAKFNSFKSSFISENGHERGMLKAWKNQEPAAAAPTASDVPSVNSQGWGLMVDANGNRAYVGPNGQIEEVK